MRMGLVAAAAGALLSIAGGACAKDPPPGASGTAGQGGAGTAGSAPMAGRAGSSAIAAGSGSGAGPGASGSQGGAGKNGSGGHASSADAGAAGAASMPLGPVIEPGDPGAADVTLDVRTDQDAHPISELIYGINGARSLDRNRFTLLRSGGNRMTAYNWENNASNAGSDYMFQNDGYLSNSNTPGAAVTPMIDQAAGAGIAALVTVPIVDYVSADKNGGGDVRNSGSNYLQTRFKQNVAAKGAAFSNPPDTSDALVFEDEFVAFLKGRKSSARTLFALDNEPDLWSHTHAEVHPNAVTYAELWERNQRFASAIKAVWPEAEVTGFVSYGWNGYVNLQNAPDANGRDFIEWYLDQAKMAEDTGGTRLIDYLDLHWYPEARGGGKRITDNGTSDPAEIDAREQAPRSLWDDSYEESSWIVDSSLHQAIALLPRLKTKIDAHYPGTKLAFTEWNYGAGNHISGAIATADALGIFGREGVGLATLWPLQQDEPFIDAAFRAYRNYDGMGASFGDTSVHAESSMVAKIAVYASIASASPQRVMLVVINRDTAASSAGVRIAHGAALVSADVYQLTAAQSELMRVASVQATAQNAFQLSLPAQSVSVVVAHP